MIGARVSRSLESQLTASSIPEEIACYYHPKGTTSRQVNLVQNNYCFGSQFKGYVVSLYSCNETAETQVFSNNVAAATVVGVFLNGKTGVDCQWASQIMAFNNKVGLVTNPPTTSFLKLQNIYLFDNELGMSAREGHGRSNSANITTVI